MPEISIIIPVYRVEDYLPATLDSVLAQTFPDWECVLVDDGSPDGSGAICDRYAAGDSRFSVIHQPNAGVSTARNAGIASAKGEFCTFLDGDDRLAPDFLWNLRSAMDEGADLTLCAYQRVTADGRALSEVRYGAKLWADGSDMAAKVDANAAQAPLFPCSDEALAALWNAGGLNSIWGKLYRLSILRERGILFDPALTFAEDMRFAAAYAEKCRAWRVVDSPLYLYLWREESLTACPRPGVLAQRYHALTAIAEEFALAGFLQAARAVRDRRDDLTPEHFLARMPNKADRLALLREYCSLPNYREMLAAVKRTRSPLTWMVYRTRSPRILLWALGKVIDKRQAHGGGV